MTFEEFQLSVDNKLPPGFSSHLKSLWYDKKGEWDRAHQIAQELVDSDGSWVHAYLHRVEGDKWNSNYWYSKAGKEMPVLSLEDEWEQLVRYFLDKDNKGSESK